MVIASLIGVRPTMSEALNLNTQPAPKPPQGDRADSPVLAHVEKWMEMIREISREQAKN
jgi:hypothetical protein